MDFADWFASNGLFELATVQSLVLKETHRLVASWRSTHKFAFNLRNQKNLRQSAIPICEIHSICVNL